jgi:hypothetical protein
MSIRPKTPPKSRFRRIIGQAKYQIQMPKRERYKAEIALHRGAIRTPEGALMKKLQLFWQIEGKGLQVGLQLLKSGWVTDGKSLLLVLSHHRQDVFW